MPENVKIQILVLLNIISFADSIQAMSTQKGDQFSKPITVTTSLIFGSKHFFPRPKQGLGDVLRVKGKQFPMQRHLRGGFLIFYWAFVDVRVVENFSNVKPDQYVLIFYNHQISIDTFLTNVYIGQKYRNTRNLDLKKLFLLSLF